MKIDKNKYDTFVDLEKHKQILKTLDGKICYHFNEFGRRRRRIRYNGGYSMEFTDDSSDAYMYGVHIANISIMDGIIFETTSNFQWEIEFNDNQEALDKIKVLEEELAKLKKIIED